MRLFTPIPLSQIKDPAVRARRAQFDDPIAVFRGTEGVQVTAREGGVDTLVGNFAKASVGVNQVNANWDLIQLTLSQVKQAVFAGHSLGGGLAQVTAARAPRKVAQVITFQAPGLPDELAAKFAKESDAQSTHYRVAGDIVPQAGETHLPGQIEYMTRFTRKRGDPQFRAAVDPTNSHKAFSLTTVLQGMDPAALTPEQKAILQYGAHDLQEAEGRQVRMTLTGSLSTKDDPRMSTEWARKTILPTALQSLGYVEDMAEVNIGYNALLEAAQSRLKKATTYEAFKAVYDWLGKVKTVPLSKAQDEMMKALGVRSYVKPTVPVPLPGKGTGLLDQINVPVGPTLLPPMIPTFLTRIKKNGNQVPISDQDRLRVRAEIVTHWMAWHPGQNQAQAWFTRIQKGSTP
ncbi:lipase family protein [Deinococcus multiflagellatus]|uniref:Alpha/beta hydrolase n=2 Tax=Deinococcus multiflagellatus TaxID=1656887 RepID=A0ABW1ZQP8_9DEIO